MNSDSDNSLVQNRHVQYTDREKLSALVIQSAAKPAPLLKLDIESRLAVRTAYALQSDDGPPYHEIDTPLHLDFCEMNTVKKLVTHTHSVVVDQEPSIRHPEGIPHLCQRRQLRQQESQPLFYPCVHIHLFMQCIQKTLLC